MDFETELIRVAGLYLSQGYQVVFRPGSAELPPFAKNFKVEIVAKRGTQGVLVSIKKNRFEMAADSNLPRYAEIISSQPGWRFDITILEGEDPAARELRGAQELPDEAIEKALDEACELVRTGFVRPALIIAWSALEAAMRRKLRASGETAGWGTPPRQLLNELYSTGILSGDVFRRLERVYRLRSEITHGFASPTLDAGTVSFLIETARGLLQESLPAKLTA